MPTSAATARNRWTTSLVRILGGRVGARRHVHRAIYRFQRFLLRGSNDRRPDPVASAKRRVPTRHYAIETRLIRIEAKLDKTATKVWVLGQTFSLLGSIAALLRLIPGTHGSK
jgi:hypothetical protein